MLIPSFRRHAFTLSTFSLAALVACGGSTFETTDGGTDAPASSASSSDHASSTKHAGSSGAASSAGSSTGPASSSGASSTGSTSEASGSSTSGSESASGSASASTTGSTSSSHSTSSSSTTASSSTSMSSSASSVQAGCPGTPPSGSCTESGETCNYPTEACICSHGSVPTTMLNWSCSMLNTGCPQSPPALGSGCTQEGLVCDYGACIGGEKVICTEGAWVNDIGGCPG